MPELLLIVAIAAFTFFLVLAVRAYMETRKDRALAAEWERTMSTPCYVCGKLIGNMDTQMGTKDRPAHKRCVMGSVVLRVDDDGIGPVDAHADRVMDADPYTMDFGDGERVDIHMEAESPAMYYLDPDEDEPDTHEPCPYTTCPGVLMVSKGNPTLMVCTVCSHEEDNLAF